MKVIEYNPHLLSNDEIPLYKIKNKYVLYQYIENMNNKNVIFKYIEYDISQFYNYDYTIFRPNIKIFLEDIFQTKA